MMKPTAEPSESHNRVTQVLAALHDISTSATGLSEVQSLAIRHAVDLLKGDAGGVIILHDPASDELVLTEGIGNVRQHVGLRLKPDEALAGRVFQADRTITVSDYANWEGRSLKFGDTDVQALLSVPLRWGERLIGVLTVASAEEGRTYTTEEVQLAEILAGYIATALGNAQLTETNDRRASHLETLRRASSEIVAAKDMNAMLEVLVRSALAIPTVVSVICDLFGSFLDAGQAGKIVSSDMPRITVSGWRSEAGEIVIGNDDPASEQSAPAQPGNAVTIPLATGTVNIGTLQAVLESPQDVETRRFLDLLAAQAAVALHNLSVVEAEREARRHSAVLLSAVRDLAATLSVDEVLRQALAYCKRIIDCQQHVILLYRYGDLTGGLASIHGRVGRINAAKMQDVYLRSVVLKRVIIKRETLVIQDVRGNGDWIAFPGEEDIRSWMGMPLIVRDDVVGVLSLYHTDVAAFSADHRELGEALASHAALAIENARLYQHMEQQADLLEELVIERTADVTRERERLKAIVESAGEGILFTDEQGFIQFVNLALEGLTGFSTDGLLGRRLFDVLPLSARLVDTVFDRLRVGETWEGEIHAERPDGSAYDIAATIAPVIERGDLIYAVAVLRDVTEQKEVTRMQQKFVENVSHELRTPITNIKVYQTLLRTGPNENRDRYLDTIASETARLERLVEDLLDISKLDRGAVELQLAFLKLDELLDETVKGYTLRLEARGLSFEYEKQDDLPVIFADRERIQRVIINLLDNAVNYSTKGDVITLRTGVSQRDGQDYVTIRVSDTGMGIAPKDLPFIFNRFFRAENAKVEGVPGTGLGLSIVKEILSLHAGRIEVQSVPNEGSTFTVSLPVSGPVVSGETDD